jgi:hypothetical protein
LLYLLDLDSAFLILTDGGGLNFSSHPRGV